MPTIPALKSHEVAGTRTVRAAWWRRAQALTLRTVMPADAPLLHGLYEGLSPVSRRQRFHGMLRPSRSSVERLCGLDRSCQQAWLVVDPSRPDAPALAEARLALDANSSVAEFALLVSETWRRRGLGSWAMSVLLQQAAASGVQWLQGEVLHDNTAMLGLTRRYGFALGEHPEEDHLLLVQRRLESEISRGVPA